MKCPPRYKNCFGDCLRASVRRLRRPTLPGEVAEYLARKQSEGATWDARSATHFRVIRQQLAAMTGGRERCAYCEDNLGTDIDHFAPKSKYPDLTFDWDNYFLACSHCNSNRKRTAFPLDGQGHPLLIDPARQDPLDHLALVPDLGELAPRTAQGRTTVEVFGLNRSELLQGRVDAWAAICALVERYGEVADIGDTAEQGALEETLQRQSFSLVLAIMCRYARSGVRAIPDAVRLALIRHANICASLTV
jgi:uncharacterized protein (TIGR02646 family)